MSFDDYKKSIAENFIDKPDKSYTDNENMLSWMALGLSGESGEVVDLIKKFVYHNHPIDLQHFKTEMGDVLWYFVMICKFLNLDIEEIMKINIDKIHKRYPNGCNCIDSVNRNG